MFSAHVAELSSGPVHYQRGGSGPPILHLHPAAGPRLTPVIEQLAARHAVYVPAAPGFNGTPRHAAVSSMVGLADLMAEFARKVAGGKCDVVAESFGGWVALWLAVKHPDLVEHLVLEGPAGLRDEGTGGVPAESQARVRALYAHPERAPPETRSPQMLAETQQMRDLYVGGMSFDTALHGALPRIAARTLILMGTKDTVVPVVTAHRLMAGIANAHLSFIYGAAHSLEFDEPKGVGRLISAFLERGEAFVVPRKGAA
jgi:pimeloyl-ACP methyl ester carboxylesterase